MVVTGSSVLAGPTGTYSSGLRSRQYRESDPVERNLKNKVEMLGGLNTVHDARANLHSDRNAVRLGRISDF